MSMTGAIVNALAIVAGGAVGLLSCRMGNFFMDDVPH